MSAMHHQLPWYVAGPVLGLCVVACRALFNGRLGVTGGFAEIVGRVARGSVAFDWRGWFALGILAGGAIYALAAGGASFSGYGWLTDELGGLGVGAALLVGGVLIGYGARTAGGCTSGNGLSGTSMLTAAGLASTATFFGTAIVVAFVIEGLT